jgi:hypothetical protein
MRGLDEGLQRTPSVVERGFDEVVATDKWHRWAVAYALWVGATGEWSSDLHLFQHAERCWRAMVVAGSHGEGWSAWTPTVDDASLIRVGERGGQDAEEDDGSDVSLIALTGYAAPGVEGVEVRQAGEIRVVSVVHDLNAFVVLGPTGDRLLTAVDASGNPLGAPLTVRCTFD